MSKRERTSATFPTRTDVARLAGVSTAVVSYVINGGPRPVSESARSRVNAAVEQLGYRPNGVARALRRGRTHSLGLVVPDNSNPYFAELARAIEDEAFERGYAMILGNSGNSAARESEQLRALVERQVDGLLVVSVDAKTAPSADLIASTPTVLLHRTPMGSAIPSIIIDNRAAANEATSHLARQHGHTDIACLAGPADFLPARDRLSGWLDALHEAGLRARPGRRVHTSISRRAGYEGGLRLLDRRSRPTAVFANSDVQAVGLLRACGELGLRVPDDVAVVAFDGTEESEFASPPLTAIQHPVEKLAAAAVNRLLSGQQTRTARGPAVDVLDHVLIVRRSCGCTPS